MSLDMSVLALVAEEEEGGEAGLGDPDADAGSADRPPSPGSPLFHLKARAC